MYIIQKEEILEFPAFVVSEPTGMADSTVLVFASTLSDREFRVFNTSVKPMSKKRFVSIIKLGDNVLLGLHKNQVKCGIDWCEPTSDSHSRINVYSLKRGNAVVFSLDDYNQHEQNMLWGGIILTGVLWFFVFLTRVLVIRLSDERFFQIGVMLILAAVFYISWTTMNGGYCRLD